MEEQISCYFILWKFSCQQCAFLNGVLRPHRWDATFSFSWKICQTEMAYANNRLWMGHWNWDYAFCFIIWIGTKDYPQKQHLHLSDYLFCTQVLPNLYVISFMWTIFATVNTSVFLILIMKGWGLSIMNRKSRLYPVRRCLSNSVDTRT